MLSGIALARVTNLFRELRGDSIQASVFLMTNRTRICFFRELRGDAISAR